jgi:segregation and condensation protein A
MLSQRTSRVEIVVTFLALLELVKRHIISANQSTLFGDINLHAEGNLDQELDIEIEFSE